MLIIICGLQGTGKTTVAKKIALKINGFLLSTDVIRRDLFEIPEYVKKIYSKKQMREVYDEMFLRAKKLIKEDKNVILDATFAKEKNRDKVKKISKDFMIIEIICPENIVKERIRKRAGDESKAKFEHYLKYKKLFEPIGEKHLVIDTSKDIDEQLNCFDKY